MSCTAVHGVAESDLATETACFLVSKMRLLVVSTGWCYWGSSVCLYIKYPMLHTVSLTRCPGEDQVLLLSTCNVLDSILGRAYRCSVRFSHLILN